MSLPGDEIVQASINWALTQQDENGETITINHRHALVDKVREKFNSDNVEYGTFGYDDLVPYLQ